MAAIPPMLGRVPNNLITMLTQQNLASARGKLLESQVQLASGKRVSRPSEDPVAAGLIGVIDRRLETSEQRMRNLTHAVSVMGTLDQAFADLNEQLLEAKTVALSQIGVASDSQTRRNQATVIDSLISSVTSALNRDFAGLHLFAGKSTGQRPIQAFGAGFRYTGSGDGLHTDLGPAINFPITIGADTAAGALSARVQGDVDLNPVLTSGTRIADLRGPGGEGRKLGSLTITIDNGTPQSIQVDLAAADTMGDVTLAIESAIRQADPAALTSGFPTAVGFSGDRLRVLAIASGYTIKFSDGPAGATARDLALDNFTYDSANGVSTNAGAQLDPKLTDRSPLISLATSPPMAFGDIVLRNGGAQGTVTTTASMTIGQLKEAIARLDLGIRLEIDPDNNTLNLLNEASGLKMAVEESGSLAATSLGIRTFKGTTPTSVFNDGRGVTIADAQTDPTTGLPDPKRNVDFRITLTDGSTFDVDLTPADIGTVADVIAKINADATSAGLGGAFTVQLAATGSGFEFIDSSGGAGALSVTSLNSFAAEDLGLLDGTVTAGSPARFISSDRAKVRVDSVLSTLIELRDALLVDDEVGIRFAGERLEKDIERVTQGRAIVGARAARIDGEQRRLEDITLMDQSIKSSLQDLDIIEASLRFSALQGQLAAANQSAATITQLTLLNFLR